MRNIKKVVFWVLIVGVLIAAAFSYYIYSTIFADNTAFNNQEAHVFIESDANFQDVLDELSPLLKDIDAFATVAGKKGYIDNVKPGHFIINKGMSNNDIVNSIRINNIPVRLNFNNQERLQNLAGRIAQQIEVDSTSLFIAMSDAEYLASKNLDLNTALCMYVPNSYEVYWNVSPTGFRDKMWDEYQAFWNADRAAKAKKLGYTREQIVSLAAIVHKETAKVEERPRVAGVYVNRLKRGMPLQADPTVIYAKKLTESDFNQVVKRVLYRDLEIDSEYNTYKNTGIPPGPIFMPDISAIDAVLNYEQHDYLFFVADVTNFGYHKFAKTLAQHNRNKQEYVLWINSQGVKR